MKGQRKACCLAVFTVIITVFSLIPGFASAEMNDAGNSDKSVINTAVPDQPKNRLPLLVINIDEKELYTDEKGHQYGTIDDMNGSTDHSIRCNGSVSIMVPDGYQGIYGTVTVPQESLKLNYIRGRGNSTWQLYQKKPYKIKFDKKQDLFGMGANKEWALLANAADITLMKNRIMSWLGEQMEMPFTPQMIPVDVVMKGSKGSIRYLGNYCLCEVINIGESRVAINDRLERNTETEDKADDPNVTGGYLISMYGDMQDDEPLNSVVRTDAGVEFCIHVPSYEGEEESVLTEGEKKQLRYLKEYFQKLENLILQPDRIDGATHEKIAEMMDLKSLADYWLIQEFSKNGDAFVTDSTYLYKDRNGKLYWGPLWDFDLAWGEQDDSSEGLREYEPDIKSFNNCPMIWIDSLRENDPQFVELLHSRWELMNSMLTELVKEEGVINQFSREIEESQKDNAGLWPDERYMATTAEEYDLAVHKLRKWIVGRQQWFTDHIDKMNNSMVTITYIVDGNTIEKETVRADTMDFLPPDVPHKEGMYFRGWFTEDTHEPISNYIVEDDIVFASEYRICHFIDVQNPDSYYFKPVYWAFEKGISNGISEDRFSTDNACSRSEVVTFLWRGAGSPEPDYTDNPFSDVTENNIYFKAVLWAVENGITTGTSLTEFSPDATCTRGQAAVFLYRMQSSPEPESEENPFDDVKENSYFYNAILWAVGNNVAEGTGKNVFSPEKPCTRAQMVTFLYRNDIDTWVL